MVSFAFNTWKALYASKSTESTTLESIAPWAGFLKLDHSADICKSHLSASDGCAGLFLASNGRVKLLHHFHHDLRSDATQLLGLR